MSTLSNMLLDFVSLLCPAQCAGCGALLEGRAEWVCTRCRAEMPMTYFHFDAENPMALKVKALCPSVVNATAQFFYINNGRWRRVIHAIKYHNAWYVAYKIGYWYGCDLLESPLYQNIDAIIPVPLHRSRLLKRRYNQSEKIAEGLAKAMNIKLNTSSLRRSRNNPSQVTQTKEERWGNVQGIFSIRDAKRLEGKHILLVDDVFTTGATLISCVETILHAVPTCRISIATMAASRNEIIRKFI